METTTTSSTYVTPQDREAFTEKVLAELPKERRNARQLTYAELLRKILLTQLWRSVLNQMDINYRTYSDALTSLNQFESQAAIGQLTKLAERDKHKLEPRIMLAIALLQNAEVVRADNMMYYDISDEGFRNEPPDKPDKFTKKFRDSGWHYVSKYDWEGNEVQIEDHWKLFLYAEQGLCTVVDEGGNILYELPAEEAAVIQLPVPDILKNTFGVYWATANLAVRDEADAFTILCQIIEDGDALCQLLLGLFCRLPKYEEPINDQSGTNGILILTGTNSVDSDPMAALNTAASDPTTPLVHLFRGRAQLHYGKYEAALEDLSIAVQQDPELSEPWYYRGLAHRLLGNETAANEDIKRAESISPDLADAAPSWINGECPECLAHCPW